MPNQIKNHKKKVYWIAHSEDLSVFHHGSIEVGSFLTTGQPVLEQFETEQEWSEAIIQLKGQEYFDSIGNGELEI